jgi:class 3 adenylate cyclase
LTHQYRSDRQAQGLAVWDIRIGIHSGPVIAGIVGRKKFAYDIWGDSVNLAARMESSAAVGTVNISRATYDLLQVSTPVLSEELLKSRTRMPSKCSPFFSLHACSLMEIAFTDHAMRRKIYLKNLSRIRSLNA